MSYQPEYLNYEYNQTELATNNSQYFDLIKSAVSQLQLQVKHIDHFAQQRQDKYKKSLTLYKSHLQKERVILQKNKRHCQLRDQWYKQQIKNSWQTAIRNRNLVLRTLARTNVIKRDADEWIARIDDDVWQGNVLNQFAKNGSNLQQSQNKDLSNMNQSQLKGSMLIDKYNQILRQYQHKL